jgi:uncharacterized membrane protein YqaE (UPF0057 family)
MKKIFARLLILVFALNIICLPASAINLTNASKDEGTPDAQTVKQAVSEFKSLTKKEKKEKFKELKKAIRDYKAQKKAAEPSTNTLLLVILAILLPPLAVYLHEGEINNKFWIDLILTLLLWLPGVIYALIVVLG